MVELFDSHLHLDDEAFDPDRAQVIARAREAGVAGMVTVGTGIASSREAVRLAQHHAGVFAAVAIHPHDAAQATEAAIGALRELASQATVVAVGETGLDFAREIAPHEVQRRAFRAHLRLAREVNRPVIIHCREAEPEVLEILQDEGAERVIMHAFSGSVHSAMRCAERGYAVSLAGPVTFRNARRTVEVARQVPLHLLLIETDAPVLAPEPHRGRRNEPSYLRHVAMRIAEVRGQSLEEIAAATTANARRIYGVDDA